MTINVTQEHIDKGIKNSCMRCPISLAVKEQLHWSYGPVSYVLAFAAHIVAMSKNGERQFTTPKSAYEFIHAFDQGKKVEPFSFDLNV